MVISPTIKSIWRDMNLLLLFCEIGRGNLKSDTHLPSGRSAAAEFQYILDHRGLAPFSLLSPLAHLGLARAAVLTGDTQKARKAYHDFFALWKDADADLPVLIEAKKEYEKLE
jgi:hypothetical protein